MGYEWMASGVYAITNKATGEQYVGCGKMFCLRWLRHVTNLERGVHHNHALQSAWNEYGRDGFDYSILEVVSDVNATKDVLMARERAWIVAIRPAYNTLRRGSWAQSWPKHSGTIEDFKWATIRQAREAHHLSLTDLAKKSGVDMPTLSRIENGKRPPSARTIQAVAAALDCTPEELGWNQHSSRATPSFRKWRLRRMMHQREIAEAAGINIGMVAQAEYGKPVRYEVVCKLVAALNVTPEELYQQDASSNVA